MISFFVRGTPVAKGSGRAFYNKQRKMAFVVQDNSARQKPWVSMISVRAEEHAVEVYDGPVALRLMFVMPRPQAHYNKKGLKLGAPTEHGNAPDVDKLARAVLDALTGIAYRDDRQVCELIAKKNYGEQPGVDITIDRRGGIG